MGFVAGGVRSVTRAGWSDLSAELSLGPTEFDVKTLDFFSPSPFVSRIGADTSQGHEQWSSADS
jgi:hypothetical protein